MGIVSAQLIFHEEIRAPDLPHIVISCPNSGQEAVGANCFRGSFC